MKNRIGYTATFKKDVKRLKKAHFNLNLMYDAIEHLVQKDTDILISQYRDHALKENWKGYRELHILADWLLIYKVEKDEINLVVLVRTGSHDKLF